MNVLSISAEAMKNNYRGCGKAWAAVVLGVDGPCVVALRYMDLGNANHRERAFADHRNISRRELSEIDGATVMSGECSCTEFITA